MEKMHFDSFYSGLSGLHLPIPKYKYPTPFENASKLTYYSSLFNSIEINSTFYKIPKPETITKWTVSVALNFKFTYKLWKGITHSKKLNFNEADVITFLNALNGVGERKGCLLLQFPPSLGKENYIQLEKLLSCLREKDNELKIAVEFRNNSWYDESTYHLLRKFNAAIVIHDIPQSGTPKINHTSNFIYIRLHGPTGNYRDGYSKDFLSEYADCITQWLNAGKQVYMYFNNTLGDAFNDAITLNSILDRSNNVKVRRNA